MSLNQDVVVPQPLNFGVAALTPLVTQFRELAHGTLEICWRTGITDDSFNEILTMFLAYRAWDSASEWRDYHEYLYELKDGTQVRTSVHFDTFAQISHVVPSCVDTLNLQVRTHLRPQVVVGTQTPISIKHLPDMVLPHLVRIIKRRSFTRGPWCFDMCYVWAGVSRSVAEELQSRGNGSYEINIRFTPDPDYWENGRHTDTYVATSLLMKMVNVMSSEMVNVEVIK
jgi:hypothetical protein